MWFTYSEFLAYCTSTFIGNLLGIGLVAFCLYGLVKLFILAIPYLLVVSTSYFIATIETYGIKHFIKSLFYFFLLLLSTILLSGIFVSISVIFANNEHTILAIISFIPAIIIAFYGIVISLLFLFSEAGGKFLDKNVVKKDKKIAVLLTILYLLPFILSLLNDNIFFLDSYIFPASIVILEIIIVVKAKYNVSTSLALSIVPILSNLFYFFYEHRNYMQEHFGEILISYFYQLQFIIFAGGLAISIILGIINRIRLRKQNY